MQIHNAILDSLYNLFNDHRILFQLFDQAVRISYMEMYEHVFPKQKAKRRILNLKQVNRSPFNYNQYHFGYL